MQIPLILIEIPLKLIINILIELTESILCRLKDEVSLERDNYSGFYEKKCSQEL